MNLIMRITYVLGWVIAAVAIGFRLLPTATFRLPATMQYDWKSLLAISIFMFVACIATAIHEHAMQQVPETRKAKGAGA